MVVFGGWANYEDVDKAFTIAATRKDMYVMIDVFYVVKCKQIPYRYALQMFSNRGSPYAICMLLIGLYTVEGSLFHRYICWNVVSAWDTSGLWQI